MKLRIEEIGPDQYRLYDGIPSRLLVESILDLREVDQGLGGFRLEEIKVERPYVKDYDYDSDSQDAAGAWAREFDLREWGILLALDDGKPVGGAAVAINADVFPMDVFQRNDLAVLWDIRVHPEAQGRGVGKALFLRAAAWAKAKGYGQLGLETQNVNVPACRFYAQMGCKLGAIHRYGYAGCETVAGETMLLWYYDL